MTTCVTTFAGQRGRCSSEFGRKNSERTKCQYRVACTDRKTELEASACHASSSRSTSAIILAKVRIMQRWLTVPCFSLLVSVCWRMARSLVSTAAAAILARAGWCHSSSSPCDADRIESRWFSVLMTFDRIGARLHVEMHITRIHS